MNSLIRSCVLIGVLAISVSANTLELDLPVSPETFTPLPPPPPPKGHPSDDPRDEPPPIFFGEEIDSPNETLVYVLDYSGSMAGGGRIDALRKEVARSISQLASTFRFNIIIYDCIMKQWAPELCQATEGNKASAIGWIEEMPLLGGGTGTGPAVALALDDKEVKAVVLLTDGDPNCGAMDHRTMIRDANTQDAIVTVFGIDAWGDYRAFCIAVAGDNSGVYFDLSVAVESK